MPRYFFHLSGLIDYDDSLGTALPNDDAARSAALTATGETLLDHQGPITATWDLAVTAVDEMGRQIATITVRVEMPPVSETLNKHDSTGS